MHVITNSLGLCSKWAEHGTSQQSLYALYSRTFPHIADNKSAVTIANTVRVLLTGISRPFIGQLNEFS